MGNDENWDSHRFRDRFQVFGLVIMSLLFQSFHCWSLNDEGLALLKFRERILNDPFGALSTWNVHEEEVNPCFWLGVECSNGKVIALNLKDLCLEGTLAPELKNLVHIKSIVLRNNSFTGSVPEGIGGLKELEVLDLGYNNLCGPLPADLGTNLSLGILLLDNNRLLGNLSPEIYQLQLLSESQVDENLLSNTAQRSLCNKELLSSNVVGVKVNVERRQLLDARAPLLKSQSGGSTTLSPSPSPTTSPSPPKTNITNAPPNTTSTSSPPSAHLSPPAFHFPPPPPTTPPPPPPPPPSAPKKSSRPNLGLILGIVGSVIFVVAAVITVYLWTTNKASVRPWATGLSGQLQKAFVTGVPKLKRSELEVACEDFSNVIGYSPIGPVYKGTLSSGVEIAVAIFSVKSSQDWSNALEFQFRKKIDTLSKINHKNFVNLIGFCEEQQPFCRMMVFEYAPNGTLFEHLHDEEFEHLDWRMRLRIAMGMAYCLEYIHNQNPPIIRLDLSSLAINLTEDYAAKMAEYRLQSEIVGDEMKSMAEHLLNPSSSGPESHVYSFGLILLELMTGRTPHSEGNGSLEQWAIEFLRVNETIKQLVDPTLTSFQEEQLEEIGQLLRSCLHSNPMQRPMIKHVTARLRAITGITPEEATPKLSPLWWAELEISTNEDR